MQSSIKTIILASMATLTLATPSPLVPEAEMLDARAVDLQARGTATVNMFSGDTCNGAVDSFSVANGGFRCVPVSNKRSISVSQGGCTVRTWSGNNCQGGSFTTGNGCFGVLYASVSVQC